MDSKKVPVVIKRSIKLEAAPEPEVNKSHDPLKSIQEFIEFTLHQFLLFPHLCKVEYVKNERTTIFEIGVEKEDFGRLMGAKGKHINAIRALVTAIGGAHGIRAVVQIKDEERYLTRKS